MPITSDRFIEILALADKYSFSLKEINQINLTQLIETLHIIAEDQSNEFNARGLNEVKNKLIELANTITQSQPSFFEVTKIIEEKTHFKYMMKHNAKSKERMKEKRLLKKREENEIELIINEETKTDLEDYYGQKEPPKEVFKKINETSTPSSRIGEIDLDYLAGKITKEEYLKRKENNE